MVFVCITKGYRVPCSIHYARVGWDFFLVMAARYGHMTCVQYLVEQCSANIEEPGIATIGGECITGVRPLWCAAAAGHWEVAAYLLSRGADVNAETDTKSTPLSAACTVGRRDIAELLVNYGAEIEASDNLGITSLMIASGRGYEDVVRYLLGLGADVNKKRKNGKNALHACAGSGHLEMMKVLLEHNAQMDVDSAGVSPLLFASSAGHVNIVEYLLGRTEVISVQEKISALELLGASLIHNRNDADGALKYWILAMRERSTHGVLIHSKTEDLACEHFQEVTTEHQLDQIKSNSDAMEMQSLLIKERILGPSDPSTIEHLQERAVYYAMKLDMKRCISVWIHAISLHQSNQELIDENIWVYFASLINLLGGLIKAPTDHNNKTPLLYFEDVMQLFEKCIREAETVSLLRKTNGGENASPSEVHFTHLHWIHAIGIRLVLLSARLMPVLSDIQRRTVKSAVYKLVKLNPLNSADVTLLHLACCRFPGLNAVLFSLRTFPDIAVVNLLLEAGADPCAIDRGGNTPLHVLARNSECPREILDALLAAGAHLDAANNQGQNFESMMAARGRKFEHLANSVRYTSLQCLAAVAIRRHGVPYKTILSPRLVHFVDHHSPS
ncbi:protein fem-1 homolog A-like isoform X2 [Macrobrachium rosenbergii]|uniref:protein fem-1 homolog A-like isoform X2 n=1 Tax=Macrobrachium rosenbergii TaxID=79674 RepID=UPI0034D40AA7